MRLTEIGQSQRTDWDRCPAYHYYAYMMGTKGWGIVPPGENRNLEYGKIGHRALQTWYLAMRSGTHYLAAADAALADIEPMLAERPPDEFDPDSTEGGDVVMVRAFMEGYARHYGPKDKDLRVESVEWSFTLTPEEFYGDQILQEVRDYGYSLDGLPNIRGTVDLIFRGSEGLVVMDHKFEKWLGKELTLGLPYWTQPVTYTNAVHRAFGEPVMGYVHNQIRKPSGLRPSVRGGHLESFEEFQARLRQEYIRFPIYPGDYTDNGRAKKGYFARSSLMAVPVGYSKFLVEMAIEDARRVAIYRDIPDPPGWTPHPPTIHRNHGACGAFGDVCPYIELCTYGVTPATCEQFTEREEPHK